MSESDYLTEALRDPAVAAAFSEESLLLDMNSLLTTVFKNSRLTYRELGERLGVSRARAHQIISGDDSNFTLSLAGRAAGCLGFRWKLALEDLSSQRVLYDESSLCSSYSAGGFVLLPGGVQPEPCSEVEPLLPSRTSGWKSTIDEAGQRVG